MKGIVIQAKNERGKKALLEHIEEKKRISRFNPSNFMYNQIFKESIIQFEPLMFQVEIKNKALSSAMKFEDLRSKVEEALIKNKAEPEDFEICEIQ